MSHNRTYRLIAAIIIIYFNTLYSAADNMRKISSREGISNNSILSLAQDKDGYIWFGSCDGLNIWNGESMTLYPDESSGMPELSGNLIEEILEIGDSLFWIRSPYGLDLFGDSGVIESHNCFQGLYKIASRNRDSTIVFTSSDKLYRYDKGTFIQIETADLPDFSDLLEMAIGEDGVLWFFCQSGISYASITTDDGGNSVLGPIREATGSRPLKNAFNKAEGVYIIDISGQLGRFTPGNGQIKVIDMIGEELSLYGRVSDIAKDGDRYMLSFLYDGVLILEPSGSSGRYTKKKPDIRCGVFSLLKDKRQDIVWIGTDGHGVIMYTRDDITFRSYTYDNMPYNLSKPVRALLLDSRQTLWVATKGEGILRIPDFYTAGQLTEENTFHITASNSRELASETVYAFEESSRGGIIWIGSEGNGINYWSYRDNRIHTLEGDAPQGLKYIHRIYESSRDTLWIATVGCGVYRLTLGDKGDRPYIKEYEYISFGQELLNKDFYFTLYPDSDGTIFFGNRGGGLIHHDPNSRRHIVYKFDKDRPATANDVWSICRSVDGRLWIGTGAGIISVGEDREDTDTPVRGTVHGIIGSRDSSLWASTNRGLVRYDIKTGNAVTYGYQYGINTIEYSDGAEYADSERDVLFFGGTNGFTTVSGHSVDQEEFIPPVLIRNIRIGSRTFVPEERIDSKGRLLIHPKERLYSIDVNALDYIDGSNYIYSYMIDNYDNMWNSTSSSITLPDLPYGKYRLIIKYYNPSSDKSGPEKSFEIIIRAPWYSSVIMKIIYILSGTAVLSGCLLIWRRRRKKRHSEHMEKIEAKRNEEILDSKVHLFENIAQELTMPLTMISGPCQQILDYGKSDSFIKSHGEKILHQSQRLRNLLRIFHDFSESNEQQLTEHVQVFSVSDIAEEISSGWVENASDRDIRFDTDIQRQIVWSTAPKEVTTIIEMLLASAFSYVKAGGHIRFRVYTENDFLNISVFHSGTKPAQDDVADVLDRFSAIDHFQKRSMQGRSFRNEMRLAVCNNISAKLQGRIIPEFASGGIAFTVELPSLKASPEIAPKHIMEIPAIIKEGNLATEISGSKEKLLQFEEIPDRHMMFIAGSNIELMNFVAELFSSEYNINMFTDYAGMEGSLAKHHPEIVICENIKMRPDILSMIGTLKGSSTTAHIPVILLTSVRQGDERIKGVESGADVSISLPFDTKYLKAVVSQLQSRLRSLKDYYRSTVGAYEFTGGRMLHRDDKEFIDKMLRIINENISDTEISTSYVAEKLGVSVRSLYHRLEGLIDITPSNIIKEYRLMYAEQLLSTTKLSIEEIIYRSGFSNRGTFFRNFSAKYGCTPKNYRKSKTEEI